MDRKTSFVLDVMARRNPSRSWANSFSGTRTLVAPHICATMSYTTKACSA